MGIRDWFANEDEGLRRAKGPSPEYPTARAVIEAMLRAHPDVGGDDDWIEFAAAGNGKKATIQLDVNQVSFGNKDVDLPRLLREGGLSALAECVRPADGKGKDLTLWDIENATTDELIEIVDFAFAKALGLGDAYKVDAEHQ
jgi:hypothetical protein